MQNTCRKSLHNIGGAEAYRFIRAIDRAIVELDESAYTSGYNTSIEFLDLREELFNVQRKICAKYGGVKVLEGQRPPAFKRHKDHASPFYESYLIMRKERHQKRSEMLIKTYDAALEMLQECDLTAFIRAERAELTKEGLSWAITESGVIYCPNCYSDAHKDAEGKYKPTTYCPHCGQKRIQE